MQIQEHLTLAWHHQNDTIHFIACMCICISGLSEQCKCGRRPARLFLFPFLVRMHSTKLRKERRKGKGTMDCPTFPLPSMLSFVMEVVVPGSNTH